MVDFKRLQAFQGEIPADDEIGDFFDQWKKAQNY